MLANQVILWNDELTRVLAVDGEQAALLPIYKKTIRVQVVATQSIEHAVTADDPYLSLRSRLLDSELAERDKTNTQRKAEANFKLIEPIVATKGIAFDGALRRRLIREQANGDISRRKLLVSLLRTYWQKGQTPNALIPEYGKNIGPRETQHKTGPKPRAGFTNPPVNSEIRKCFDHICRKYILKGEKSISIKKAYDNFTALYKRMHPELTNFQLPSFHQLRYYYYQTFTASERHEHRVDPRRWRKDMRPLPGSVYDIVDGIGHTWSYDATIADIYLASESDRSEGIGRPRVECITDDYSKMIVGFRVSLENTSSRTAFGTLFNAMRSKPAFVKELTGEDIQESNWPACGIPLVLKGDNGELNAKQSAYLTCTLGIRIELTPGFRADSKGVVERSFGLIQAQYGDVVDATPSKQTTRKAGGEENRPKASLTFSEYCRIVLRAVMLNNQRALQSLPPEFPADKMMHRPIDVWNWAMKHGHCRQRNFEAEQDMRIVLLPRQTASFSKEGIKVNGLRYWSSEAAALGWMDRGKKCPRPKDLEVAVDHCDVSQVYLFPNLKNEPLRYWICPLHSANAQFKGMTLVEAKDYKRQAGAQFDRTDREHDVCSGEAHEEFEAIAKNAKELKPPVTKPASQLIKAIPENRRREQTAIDKASRKMPENRTPEPPSAETEEPDYALPNDYVPPFLRK